MPDLDMMGGAAPQRPDNHEASMARADLYKCANYSFKLFKMIQDGQELEGWVQAKITKAADYIASVYHYMEYEMKFNEYGKKLQDSDMYTESVKKQFVQKLTEARAKLDKLKEKNISDLEEGWEDMMKASKEREKEKGTGKFDKKQTSTGTVYTRKSSTFDDGGKDSDTKKAEKKAKKVSEEAKKVDVPAYKRKAQGGDWKVTQKDLDKDDENKMSSKAGLEKRKKELGMAEALKGGQKKLDVDKDGKLEKSDFAKLRASKGVKEAAKPDFLDMDKDGNKKEPMKKAIADKKVKEATGGYSAKDARAGKDLGKPGKNFAKIAAKAGKEYGSKERGEKVAGAVLAKLRKG